MKRQPLKDVIIGFDFDGTLFGTDWPNVGEPIDQMHWLINELYRRGFVIMINTARSTESAVSDAKTAMSKFNLQYDTFNSNPKYRIDYYGADPRKCVADVFIDDRNAGGLINAVDALYWVLQQYEEKQANGTLSDNIYFK